MGKERKKNENKKRELGKKREEMKIKRGNWGTKEKKGKRIKEGAGEEKRSRRKGQTEALRR